MVLNAAAAFLFHHWMMLVLNQAVHQTVGNCFVIIVALVSTIIVIVAIFRQDMLQYHSLRWIHRCYYL